MELEILCTPEFTDDEMEEIDAAARSLGTTREDVIRQSVRFFASQCVPTHSGETPNGRAA